MTEAAKRKLPVVLVTDDQDESQEDWYQIRRGRARGARPELREEIDREAHVDLYVMTMEAFLGHARAALPPTEEDGDLPQEDLGYQQEVLPSSAHNNSCATKATEVGEQSTPRRRRRKSVAIIYDHNLIPDGASITLELEGIANKAVIPIVYKWLDADPERREVTWSPHPTQPLRWAVEPERRWTPSALVNEIFSQAGLPAPTFSAADVWCYEDRCLYVLANSVSDNP